MLITLKEILQIAEERNIAVGAFNAVSLESLQANFQAAEEMDVPLIIQFAQCHEPLIPLELIGPIMVDFAKRAKGPVCVAFSGGVDSSLLLKMACESAEKFHNPVYAVTFWTMLHPACDLEIAGRVAAEVGADHHVIEVNELELEALRNGVICVNATCFRRFLNLQTNGGRSAR